MVKSLTYFSKTSQAFHHEVCKQMLYNKRIFSECTCISLRNGRNLAIVLFLIGCYQRYKSETLHSKNPDWKSIGELFSGKDGCFLALPPKERTIECKSQLCWDIYSLLS